MLAKTDLKRIAKVRLTDAKAYKQNHGSVDYYFLNYCLRIHHERVLRHFFVAFASDVHH